MTNLELVEELNNYGILTSSYLETGALVRSQDGEDEIRLAKNGKDTLTNREFIEILDDYFILNANDREYIEMSNVFFTLNTDRLVYQNNIKKREIYIEAYGADSCIWITFDENDNVIKIEKG